MCLANASAGIYHVFRRLTLIFSNAGLEALIHPLTGTITDSGQLTAAEQRFCSHLGEDDALLANEYICHLI